MVRPPQTSTGQASSGAELQPLFAKLRVVTDGDPLPATPVKARSEVTSLIDRIRDQQSPASDATASGPARPSQPQGSPSPAPEPLSRSRTSAEGAQRDADGLAAGAVSTGKLWGAIEPCWRNLGARGRVAVVLEVALDNRGGLRTPPRVIRSETALLSEARLQAEASALAAIAACAPRGDLQFGGKTYRVEFPAAP